tara:strand:- start:2153 stop:2332 length:180 start_codon:yes stop_codon:yes gene_type:complete
MKHKWREIDMTIDKARQELNRLIDFYRDMVSKSNYKSASHTIKEAEKALDFLCSAKEGK